MPNPGRQKATQRIWPNGAGGELESNKTLSVHLCALRWIILLWYYYQTTATTSFPDYHEDINLLYAFWRLLVHPKTIVRNSIVSDNNPRGTRLTQDNNECFYAEPNLWPWSSGIPRQQQIRWWSIASTTTLPVSISPYLRSHRNLQPSFINHQHNRGQARDRYRCPRYDFAWQRRGEPQCCFVSPLV